MHYKEYKTILSTKNRMNIYRGCSHGCIYCDSRSKCYQMTHGFEDIEVKKDVVHLLEMELRKKRKKAMISTGAMSDPYIHIENDLEITRECLKVIDNYGFGLSILTKSNRILRDMDVLKSINENSKCVVQVTLTTFDDMLCKELEPNVSVTSERIEVLKKMSYEDIPTIVWLGPILPFINDSEENLIGLLNYCIEAKVKGILSFAFGVTLREGNREYFYNQLDRKFPNIKKEYIKNYGNSYVCSCKNYKTLNKIFIETCEKHSIMYKTKDIFDYLEKYEEKDRQISFF